MKYVLPASVSLLIACLMACLAGCASHANQTQARGVVPAAQSGQVASIVKSSKGNWNNLTPAQRQYMIKTVGKGSPIAAQMDFWAANNQLNPSKNIQH